MSTRSSRKRKSQPAPKHDEEETDEKRNQYGLRPRTKTAGYGELEQSLEDETPEKSRRQRSSSSEPEQDEKHEKASTLFEEQQDIAGGAVFGFKTPKKRDGMARMAENTPKTPKSGGRRLSRVGSTTPKTPRGGGKVTKTPHAVRKQIKNRISAAVKEVAYSSESDFSASESEYEPDQSSSEADDGEESGEEVNVALLPPPPPPPTTPTAPRRRGRLPKDLQQYVLQSDDYFSSHASAKVTTSDRTLDRLRTPRLAHDQLFSLLAEMKISGEHERAIKELHEDHRANFSKWMFLLNEGYNILLYGLGSKRALLQAFHREQLGQRPVVVINGFFPSLTIKDVLDTIATDVLDMPTIGAGNHHELVDAIRDEFARISDTHLFLIVHNIEGAMLRNAKAQSVLSRLSSIPNVHLLASIDHIKAPLIWDNTKLSNYNFSWWDVTTMLPYADETAYENSLLVQNSGALALSSLKNVFASLTTNGKGIFLLIIRSQLKNKGNPQYQGVAFKDLYSSCREAFLVSSDLALRAQLTEFFDHKLVKTKRSYDGEYLSIPIEHGLLEQFLDEQQAADD